MSAPHPRCSFALLTVAAAAALTLAPTTVAQTCPGGGSQVSWQNDNLPQVPQGQFSFSIIPGLCEGEAAATVFSLSPADGPQRLSQVTVPFGSNGGVNGNQAAVNIEIYDGLTWVGNTPVLGTKVFDLQQDVSANMQVVSTGLNTYDISAFNVDVGNGTDAFVVAARMLINLNGNCATGYSSNFFTDNSQAGFTCDPNITKPKTNLMDILGQGWVDASVATVQGFPLCPLFYSGNWVIRACSTPLTNPIKPVVLNNPVPLGQPVQITWTAPGHAGETYFAACSFGNSPGLPLADGVLPLNYDGLFALSISTPTVFVNFFGILGPGGTAPGLVLLPADPILAGLAFHTAFVVLPLQPGPWSISDSAQIQLAP